MNSIVENLVAAKAEMQAEHGIKMAKMDDLIAQMADIFGGGGQSLK